MARRHSSSSSSSSAKLFKKGVSDAAAICSAVALVVLILIMMSSSSLSGSSRDIPVRVEPPCEEIYVVGEGETLHTISDKCGDPYIVERNPHIHDPDDVFPGLVIRIMPPNPIFSNY